MKDREMLNRQKKHERENNKRNLKLNNQSYIALERDYEFLIMIVFLMKSDVKHRHLKINHCT